MNSDPRSRALPAGPSARQELLAGETPPRVSVIALGCKSNQEEMECLLSRLGEAGCRIVSFGEPADWIVVNTCTVTGAGDSDSRQMVRRALRGKGSGRVLVTGCLAQRDPQTFAAMPGVDWVLGNAEKGRIDEWILRPEREERPASVTAGAAPDTAGPGPGGGAQVLVSPDPTVRAFPPFGTATEGRRTRATLKIQDGCEEHCTYCIIPSVRGASRSRPAEDILVQARRLADSGFREIVLTGINTAAWGHDLPGGSDLPELLRILEDVPGLERIRLNSLEPQAFSPSFCERLAACSRLCAHLHLPLQSGDAAVLRRMGRRYRPEEYARIVRELVGRIPGVAIGADVLVGFPGETEREFRNTEELIEGLPLAYLHVFSYSPRPGTPSTRLPEPPAVPVRRERARRLRALDGRLRERFALSQLGTVHTVLPESEEEGLLSGFTGNYLRVLFPAGPVHGGSGAGTAALRVRLVRLDGRGRVRGEPLGEDRGA